jgi:hypothetical protein
VRANPVGVSKSVKRIIEAKIPDLGALEVSQNHLVDGHLRRSLLTVTGFYAILCEQDISEYIEGSAGMNGMASDSEAEDENSRVSRR